MSIKTLEIVKNLQKLSTLETQFETFQIGKVSTVYRSSLNSVFYFPTSSEYSENYPDNLYGFPEVALQ